MNKINDKNFKEKNMNLIRAPLTTYFLFNLPNQLGYWLLHKFL